MRTGYVAAAGGRVEVTKLILGTCYFGTDISEAVSYDLLDTYYAAGGRTLDTARAYGLTSAGVSESERLIGRWMKGRGVRNEMVVISKGGFPAPGDMHASRLSARELRADLEASLRDLDTDTIDLYFLHRDDPRIPVNGLMDTLHEFVESGAVRAIGASNWTTARIREANAYARRAGKTPFTASEIQWSLASSTPADWKDDTLVCMNAEEYADYLEMKLPVMAFSPQAKGIFSKYIAGGKAALSPKVIDRFLTAENLRKIERVRALVEQTGFSPAALALGYLLNNPLAGFAVLGCSNRAQLLDSLSADTVALDSALFEQD